MADLQTLQNSSKIDNIRSIYSSSIASELIEFNHQDNALSFTSSGYISNANYSCKKFNFILFINHRLVSCSPLKRQIESVFNAYLPKGTHPFVYLSIEIKRENVDVNVHPTKSQVHFLNQDKIIESICTSIQATLENCNQSRKFNIPDRSDLRSDLPRVVSQVSKKPSNLIRGDSKLQTLDSFLVKNGGLSKQFGYNSLQSLTSQSGVKRKVGDLIVQDTTNQNRGNIINRRDVKQIETIIIDDDDENMTQEMVIDQETNSKKLDDKQYNEIKLTSILELRNELQSTTNQQLSTTISNHIFIGFVDSSRIMVSYNTSLLMCNFKDVAFHFFYQQILKYFGNFGVIDIFDGLDIKDMVLVALDHEDWDWNDSNVMSKSEISIDICDKFMEFSGMFLEYFMIKVRDGKIYSLPNILKGYTPNVVKLPLFLIKVGSEVDFTDEKTCFDGLCKQLAMLYTPECGDDEEEFQSMVKNVLFPGIKRYGFNAPNCLQDAFSELVDLPQLYKVFERC